MWYPRPMKIIVACSGGPDSMALLDMERKKGKEIVVAHVNYHQRDSALRDERYVKTYCEKYGIACFVLDPHYNKEGNFQAWARKVRYDFFEQIARKEGVRDLYVAHHLDDSLETYLFQKRRKMLCDHYGLVASSSFRDLTIYRPLLRYEKKELEQYCIEHDILYGIDESNLTDHYTRNEIRHTIIEHMSKEEKCSLQARIDKENEQWVQERSKGKQALEQKGLIPLLEDPNAWFYLDLFLSEKIGCHLSRKHLNSLVEQLHTNCVIDLGNYELERHNDVVLIGQKTQYPTFLIDNEEELKNFQSLDLGNYRYSFNNKGEMIEGITLNEKDFPLTLRPAHGSDRITLRFGRKSLRRFWIDRKIPHLLRKQWYVLANGEGTVIFVPQIGCDISHFSIKPTCFMLQLPI